MKIVPLLVACIVLFLHVSATTGEADTEVELIGITLEKNIVITKSKKTFFPAMNNAGKTITTYYTILNTFSQKEIIIDNADYSEREIIMQFGDLIKPQELTIRNNAYVDDFGQKVYWKNYSDDQLNAFSLEVFSKNKSEVFLQPIVFTGEQLFNPNKYLESNSIIKIKRVYFFKDIYYFIAEVRSSCFDTDCRKDVLLAFPKKLSAGYCNAQGMEFYNNKLYYSAELMFRNALILDPKHILANYNLACVYALQIKTEDFYQRNPTLRTKHYQRALKQLEKAIQVDPSAREKAKRDKDLESLANWTKYLK